MGGATLSTEGGHTIKTSYESSSSSYTVNEEPDRIGGGNVFTASNGQGGAQHATDGDQQSINLDGIFDVFKMFSKAKKHSLKPDFSDSYDAFKGGSEAVTQALGKEVESKSGFSSSEPTITVCPSCHSGDKHDGVNNPVYRFQSDGTRADTLKPNNQTGIPDTFRVRKI